MLHNNYVVDIIFFLTDDKLLERAEKNWRARSINSKESIIFNYWNDSTKILNDHCSLWKLIIKFADKFSATKIIILRMRILVINFGEVVNL